MTEAAGSDTVQLVPHTHWDREWYEPFQRFRLRLVDLLDDVLDRADRDESFCFTLDGQMAAVDDYLEVRPERRPLLEKLVGRGQIAVGPWQILLDEFLCSGETIVRNLEMGSASATALGRVMAVGYLPDEFGHCAQMPQILARAGLRHACLWRGVPASVDAHAFRWEAPDGTAVRTEYLVGGYGNAADIFSDGEGLQRRYARLVERLRPWFPDAPILAMYGTDHAAPLPTLMSDVDRINSDGDAGGLPPMRVTTLAAYVEARDPDEPGLDVVRGELRSHARANILPGVLSVRWQLKDLMARAERMVERYAEPMATLWSPEWPEGFLAMAWRRLVDSSCHDSVTGCGVDETALQVAARIAEAEHLGQAVRDRVAAGLARAVPSDAHLVVNPSPRRRAGLVTLDLPVPADWTDVSVELPGGERGPAQLVGHGEQVLVEETVAADDLAALWRRVHGRELFGREIRSIDYDASADPPTVTFHVGEPPHPTGFDPDRERDRLADAARRDQRAWRVRILDEARRTVHALVSVPPLGWTGARPVPGATPVEAPVSVSESGGLTLANPLIAVQVRPDGALRVEGADGTVLDGVARIVDGGDVGDTYNYGPPAHDVLVDEPVDVAVSVLERGPLLGALEVRRRYRWPFDTDPAGRSSGADGVALVEVVTRVEVRAGEPFCRLEVSFDNRCRDHRVRLHVPTGRPATASSAEGQFAVVERGLQPEGGPSGEAPIPTYPAYGFVDAGGAGVLLTRATEYELVDGRELAITLLRGTARISRNVHPLRDEPAGPQIPTPDAQCPGLVTTQLAVLPHAGSWSDARLVDAAESFRLPLVGFRGAGAAGAELTSARGLSISGGGVAMTALRRREDWMELRVVAESPTATTATISGDVTAARRCDLFGRPAGDLEVHDGSFELDLHPWEIATVQVRRA